MDKRIMALFALILLILSGCQGLSFGTNKEQATADDSHKGVKGITMTFVKNSPPDTIFSGSSLDVIVELRNEGASSVVGGTLYLTGYDSRIFNIRPQYVDLNEDDLVPRTKFDLVGGYQAASFHTDAVTLPQGTDVFDQIFQATACYMYRTEARIPVCIDPNPNTVLETEVCKPTNPVVGGGQGAPVAVTAVREDPAPGKVNFLITVTNSGNGIVLDRNSLSNCLQPKFNDVDTVYYAVRLSGATGDCQPVQKIRMANKQGLLYCKFTLLDSTSPAYRSVLELDLDYGYSSQLSKTVRVKSVTI